MESRKLRELEAGPRRQCTKRIVSGATRGAELGPGADITCA